MFNPVAEPQLMTVETAEVWHTIQLHQCPVIGSQSFCDHVLYVVLVTAVECLLSQRCQSFYQFLVWNRQKAGLQEIT